ncbi:MAG: endonuclease [Salinibacter sp.]|uniref:endonuclease n=1 Tax=Salinibacter sp. TaxID=2065818 RepID=UPI0035D48542
MIRPLQGFALAVAGVLSAVVFVSSASAQVITIDEARSQGPGATVTVEGTVTRAFGNFVRFQDESGPTGASGLVVRQTADTSDFRQDVSNGTIKQGTELRVSGTLSEFNGLLQINEGNLDSYTVQGQGSLPSPQEVTLSTLQSDGEDYESELVSVTGLDVQFPEWKGGQWTFGEDRSYPVSDGTTELTFRVQDSAETALIGTPVPEGSFTYTGVVGEFQSAYQLIPTERGDLPLRFATIPRFVQVQEGGGSVDVSIRPVALEGDESVSVTAEVGGESTADEADVTGFDGPKTFTFSGGDSSPKTLSLGAGSDDVDEGVERLEITLTSPDGKIGRPGRFTLWILDSPAAQAPIAEGDSGDVLLQAVQQQYGDPRPMGYDIARDSMYATIYNEANNTVEGTYSGFQIAVDPSQGDPSSIAADKGINTEHVWPRSKGAGQEPAFSDLHILVPTRSAVNTARNNYAFGEIPDPDTDTWYFEDRSRSSPPSSNRPAWSELDDSPSDRADRRFEPRHSVKGDVARAIFYFATVYPNRADFSFFDAQRDTLLAWHEQDPVDATEMRRNLIQASYQDNTLNPFVVDATLADRAYGSGADTGQDPGASGTYELFADKSDLDPGSGNVDAQCLVQLSSGELMFFNGEEGGIYVWDGSSLTTHRSASDLNGDVPDESNDFNRCDGVTTADGFVYFVLRSTDTDDNYVYRTEAADSSNNAFSQFNGANALAADASTVYIGGVESFGAPGNGVFEISNDLSGSASEVATNSDVNPGSMDLAPDGTLYGFSTSFGSGDFEGTVFSVDAPASSPSIDVFTDPYAGNSPLTPDPDFGGGIDDLQFIDFAGISYLVVSNGGGSEHEWGTIEVSSKDVELLFEQDDLETNLSVGGYDAFTAPLAANSEGEVFAASGGEEGPDYIAKVSDAPPLPVEMAGFDAVRNGSSVELTWQTASETNNAGFNVQLETESGWTPLGFKASKASGGTTTETTSYRYTVDRELDPGTHRFRLQQKDLDGSTSLSDVVTVDVGMDQALSLSAPAPNPAVESTTLSFGVKEPTEATVTVYNVLGQRVQTLYQGTPRAGETKDVMVNVGSLPSGVYFVRLRANGQTRTERLTILR